ncbi:MAG: rod shape-determining protein MreC [Ilumatobacter sp.]|nr:rod shape-determining protein MreC [Ilumatobacter sp.]
MAIYSAGRRRTIIVLLLTSVLLITLDLRGNAVFNGIRSGFEYAFRPFEIAGEVVARPVSRVWKGVTQVDDLEDEVARLQEIVDRQRQAEIAGDNALIENRELRDLLDIESVANFDLVQASIIGSSPSNFDQRVEISAGSTDGIRVGMPVVNSAGLVGRITQVNPTTAVVMLATDPQYHVPVKVVAEIPAAELIEEPVTTTPSGVPVDELDGSSTTSTTSTTTSTSTSTTTTTTLPDPATFPGSTLPEELTTPVDTTTTSTTTTTTTTLPPVIITRETGVLDGYGGDRLPRVRFIADSPQFGRIEPGDAVLTSGGSESLAPPNIPVGRVANVISNAGTQGLELEVELNADLDRLNFLTVVLYLPPQGSSLN